MVTFPVPVQGHEVKELPLEKSTLIETVVQLSKGDINRKESNRKTAAKVSGSEKTGALVEGGKITETAEVKVDFSLEVLDLRN